MAPMTTTALDRELQTFERERPELVRTSLGRWVLIHGDDVVGVFDTQNDGIADGYRRFGNVPFLVKEVTPFDVPTFITSNLIAL